MYLATENQRHYSVPRHICLHILFDKQNHVQFSELGVENRDWLHSTSPPCLEAPASEFRPEDLL
jgi:hypothetical protein